MATAAAENNLAASMTLQHSAGIFPVHSLPQIARKRLSGRRKHLDLIIEDIHRRNTEIDTFDNLSTIIAHKEARAIADKRITDTSRLDFWDPPYVTGGAPGKVMARSVNTRRTVDGSFFEAINPSLFQQPVPSTQPPRGRYQQTMTALNRPKTAPQGSSTAALHAQTSNLGATKAEAKRPTTAAVPSKTGSSMQQRTSSRLNSTWLTPLETGDRREGMRVAKMVTHRRQQTGAFFEDRPTPIKIG